MIEQLSKLVKKSGAKSIHLSITPIGDDVQVTIITEALPLPDEKENNDVHIQNIRAALAQPVTMQGAIGEMDVFCVEELTKYAETYIPATKNFLKGSNADSIANAVKKSSKKPKNTTVNNDENEIVADEITSSIKNSDSL